MNKLMFGLLLVGSVSTFGLSRVENPCWNTRLSKEAKKVCAVCTAEVEELMMDQVNSPCIESQEAVRNCLLDIENCANYQELLIERDNCKTNLIKSCIQQ